MHSACHIIERRFESMILGITPCGNELWNAVPWEPSAGCSILRMWIILPGNPFRMASTLQEWKDINPCQFSKLNAIHYDTQMICTQENTIYATEHKRPMTCMPSKLFFFSLHPKMMYGTWFNVTCSCRVWATKFCARRNKKDSISMQLGIDRVHRPYVPATCWFLFFVSHCENFLSKLKFYMNM